MTVISTHHQAQFETTKRLLSQLVNERLAQATLEIKPSTGLQYICINCPKGYKGPEFNRKVKICIHPEASISRKGESIVSWIRPQTLQPIIFLCEDNREIFELGVKEVFLFISPWLRNDANRVALQRVEAELELTAMFQEKWLERNLAGSKPSLESSTILWEQAITFGHPNHPMHRCFRALAPIYAVEPSQLSTILAPSIALITVPRADIIQKGPFDSLMKPILQHIGIVSSAADSNIVVPCFTLQLPLIYKSFPRAQLLKIIEECADAEASIRSIRLRPHMQSRYLFKMSLACQITAALRTITPWDVFQTTEATRILDKIAPDFWMYREVAAVCGAQDNHEEASNLACILREDPEPRAKLNDESMIIVGALVERLPGALQTRLQMLFNLETIKQKQKWMRDYTKKLFEAVFPILCQYGISLEGHLQNFLVRVCNKTRSVKGFVYRDFGGVLMHKSTLRDRGFDVNWMHPKGRILTDDLEFIWQQTHHTVIQSHIGNVLHALDLDKCGGWGIIREELEKTLRSMDCNGREDELFKYMTREDMDVKCYFEMRIKDTRSVSNDLFELLSPSELAGILGNHEKGSKYSFDTFF